MRFIDEVTVRVISGAGGDGHVSFHREKYVAYGGPNGGDGGRGGDVVLVADPGENTLLHLHSRPWWKSDNGERGGRRNCTGASGPDLLVRVPVGTRVYDEDSGEQLADLTEVDQRWVAAEGGAGGYGNAHFKSSTNRTPTESTPGQPGQDRTLRLELRLMADVGLLGFPNAGKSTLISRISAARPRVADYPFTTLVPSLGVVSRGTEGSFVVADIPGLIRGAAQGAGLGHQFLRHLLRNRLLLHLISLADADGFSVGAEPPEEGAEPVPDGIGDRYLAIRQELKAFDPALAALPELIVLTKADAASRERAQAALEELASVAPRRPVMVISAVSGEGVPRLLDRIWTRLQAKMPS